MRFIKQRLLAIVLAALLLMPVPVLAQSSSSTHYQVDQTFFGSGGQDACSSGASSYCAKQTAGELTVGNTCSGNAYCAYGGFNTTDEPFIEFVVTTGSIDLGFLSDSSATTTTGTFFVRAWQADGYVVRTVSDPPKNGNYTLTALSSPTASSPGTEQFGINLVNNSSPNVGLDPVQIPDATFSFGQAYTGYDTPDVFKYVKDDIIARSTRSTSVTQYTISYLFNINGATPAGEFTFAQTLVATGTY